MPRFTITIIDHEPRADHLPAPPAITEFKTDAFIFIANDEDNDRTNVAGELTQDFLQELLILNPVARFAEEYEKAHKGDSKK